MSDPNRTHSGFFEAIEQRDKRIAALEADNIALRKIIKTLEIQEGETHNISGAECPHCGHVDLDSWEWCLGKGDDNHKCEHCSKRFSARLQMLTTYVSTTK